MEEILSVEGVDASLVGINDLSIPVGINPPDALPDGSKPGSASHGREPD